MKIFAAIALCILLALVLGCGKPKGDGAESTAQNTTGQSDYPEAGFGAGPQPPPSQTHSSRSEAGTDIPGRVTVEGVHIPFRMRDPKHPNGPPIPVLIADARTGTIENQSDNPAGSLNDVRAKLYRAGEPAANLIAPHMTANLKEKIIIATGGVTLTSLTDPPDTVITADRMTWDTRTSKIVATGHVHAKGRTKDGTPFEQSGGTFTIDISKKPPEITVQ